MYRVKWSWEDGDDLVFYAGEDLDEAKAVCNKYADTFVFDETGNKVYESAFEG